MKSPVSSSILMLGMVLFFLYGIGVPEAPRFRYLGWGLFLCALSTLIRI